MPDDRSKWPSSAGILAKLEGEQVWLRQWDSRWQTIHVWLESSTVLAITLPEQARVTTDPCSKERCKGMSGTLSCYSTEIPQQGASSNPSKHHHVDSVAARPPLPAANPAEACKGRTSSLGPRRLVSVAFARELLQRRFALCYNHMVCKMIVKSLLAFPPQTSYFQLLTVTQI